MRSVVLTIALLLSAFALAAEVTARLCADTAAAEPDTKCVNAIASAACASAPGRSSSDADASELSAFARA